VSRRFRDRADAGQQLASALAPQWSGRSDLVVLGLPRGGVVVAAQVARALEAPLDALVVRTIGVPGHEQLALGAVARGGPPVLNEQVLRAQALLPAELDRMVGAALADCEELESRYRPRAAPVDVHDRAVLLVDDGLATGATMRAAVAALREQRPAAVVVAVPVAPRETLAVLEREADAVACLQRPLLFRAVGWAYDDFAPVGDDQVVALLSGAGG
jgi:putative phosphoribosyl transferase